MSMRQLYAFAIYDDTPDDELPDEVFHARLRDREIDEAVKRMYGQDAWEPSVKVGRTREKEPPSPKFFDSNSYKQKMEDLERAQEREREEREIKDARASLSRDDFERWEAEREIEKSKGEKDKDPYEGCFF